MIKQTKVENGWLRGIPAADPRVMVYRGVPFAAPPVGENRWRAPQPAKDWDGVLDCARFAPISMQAKPGLQHNIYEREWNPDPDIDMSEDCLYLNIWTPAKTPDENLPVFVWYFGGGLQEGNTTEMEFNGEFLARHGVVVVSVNYRLNVFGFLAHPEITKEAPDFPCNFGNLDQRAGLLWVRRNISAFGGDPENITIGGQSAGGGSVQTQLCSPLNKGLFKRAVIMSGTFLGSYGRMIPGDSLPLAEAERRGVSFFDFLGVKSLEEARAIPAQELMDRYLAWRDSIPMRPGEPIKMVFETTIDGNFCPGSVAQKMRAGDYIQVPLMIGNTRDEFVARVEARTDEEFKAIADKYFGDKAGEWLKLIDAPFIEEKCYKSSFSPVEAGARAILDAANDRASLAAADSSAKVPVKNYYYQFDADIPGWDDPGAFHSVDLWFFFGSLAACWRPFTGKHFDLAEQMVSYWANFFKDGDPNGCDRGGRELPVWESYNESRAPMTFIHKAKMGGPEDESPMTRFIVKTLG